MGLYVEPEVIRELTLTDNYLQINVFSMKNNELGIYNRDIASDEFFLLKLRAIWNEFFHLVESKNVALDDNTQYCQGNYSVGLFFTMQDYMENKYLFLSRLVQVLYEYGFWTGVLSNELREPEIDKLINHFISLNQNESDLLWVRDNMQYALMKWVLYSKRFLEAKGFLADLNLKREAAIKSEAIRDADSRTQIEKLTNESLSTINNSFNSIIHSIKTDANEVSKLASDISKSLEEIKALEERVSKLRTEYNFVGLSSGFNHIKEKKDEELRTAEVFYKNLFGCMFICPLVIIVLHVFFPEKLPQGYNVLQIILPFLTIEMVMLYFFRLSYLEAKSLRAQLLQIDLKLSLCSFIDNYVKYRKEHNTNVRKVLDSFDAVIFSPIQSNENNIPSMFDGVEVLANLADKIIKK